MTKALTKVVAVEMERRRWTEYSYLMELDGDKERESWKNDGYNISA